MKLTFINLGVTILRLVVIGSYVMI